MRGWEEARRGRGNAVFLETLLWGGLDSPCPIPLRSSPAGPRLTDKGLVCRAGASRLPGWVRRGEPRARSINGASLPLEWGPGRGRGRAWVLASLHGHGGSLVRNTQPQWRDRTSWADIPSPGTEPRAPFHSGTQPRLWLCSKTLPRAQGATCCNSRPSPRQARGPGKCRVEAISLANFLVPTLGQNCALQGFCPLITGPIGSQVGENALGA